MKKIIFLLLGALFYFNAGYSQIQQFNVTFKPVANPQNSLDSLIRIQCNITLQSLSDIEKIHFKIGSAQGGSDIFTHQFKYNSTSGLPSGMQYTQSGNQIIITLGSFRINKDYYYEAKLEFNDGTFSSPIIYHFQ